MVKIVPADLKRFIKSKKDIYEILLYEGQYYLPPYDDCPMDFLRDALSGAKLLLKNKDVTHVSVPRYKEFNVKNLLKLALLEEDLRTYLPDFGSDAVGNSEGATISKKFLFNVIASVKPDFWQFHIRQAMKQRREKTVYEELKYVEMKNEFY